MKSIRMVVVGAGTAGSMAVREMRRDPRAGFDPVAFVDDDPNKQQTQVEGLPVLGGRSDLPDILRSTGADEILIALPSVHSDVIRSIVITCRSLQVRFRIVPPVLEIIRGDVHLDQIRQIEPEDLLGRQTVEPDTQLVAATYAGQRILVTGAGGSIGGELVRQVLAAGPEVLWLWGRGENSLFETMLTVDPARRSQVRLVLADLRDQAALERFMEQSNPQIVLHAAAHKHVTFMEHFPEEAVTNNILATRALMDAADHHGVERFVVLSTDKAVNPRSVMGATKRVTELMVQARGNRSSGTHFMAVRFGNVLGSRGSVVPLFRRQIAQGGPVTVTGENVTRYFMTVKEAAMLVLKAGAVGESGDVFVLDMGEQIKIIDLAKELIVMSGLRPHEDIEIEIVGLQPGEKIREALAHDFENLDTTALDKVRVIKQAGEGASRVEAFLPKLEEAASRVDRQGIRALLSELLPEATLARQS